MLPAVARHCVTHTLWLPQTSSQLRSWLISVGLTPDPAAAIPVPSLAIQYELQSTVAEAIGGEDGAGAFWAPPGLVVPRVDGSTISPLEFHRRFVARNTPVILTNFMNDVRVMMIVDELIAVCVIVIVLCCDCD